MSPAYNMYEHAKKVLDGAVEDDDFFAFVAEPDKGDDPFKESTWIKIKPKLWCICHKGLHGEKSQDSL